MICRKIIHLCTLVIILICIIRITMIQTTNNKIINKNLHQLKIIRINSNSNNINTGRSRTAQSARSPCALPGSCPATTASTGSASSSSLKAAARTAPFAGLSSTIEAIYRTTTHSQITNHPLTIAAYSTSEWEGGCQTFQCE